MDASNPARVCIVVLMVAALLGGCQITDPYTGEQKVSKTTKGAGIGALLGATAGALTGDNSKERRTSALVGAGVGALAGGTVGNYMDRQEAKLRTQLQSTAVSVTRNGNDLTLHMPGNITFKTGSADLNEGFFDVLGSVAMVLKGFDKTVIDVAGHTDSTGSLQTNNALSQRRADTVAQYLRSKGVLEQRIVAVGYGPSRPIASNDTAEGRQQNRRVELTLSPMTAD